MRESGDRFSKICVLVDLLESFFDRGILAWRSVSVLESLVIWTDGPELVVMMSMQCFVFVGLIYCPVAPVLEITNNWGLRWTSLYAKICFSSGCTTVPHHDSPIQGQFLVLLF